MGAPEGWSDVPRALRHVFRYERALIYGDAGVLSLVVRAVVIELACLFLLKKSAMRGTSGTMRTFREILGGLPENLPTHQVLYLTTKFHVHAALGTLSFEWWVILTSEGTPLPLRIVQPAIDPLSPLMGCWTLLSALFV